MAETFAETYGPVALVTGASSGIGWGFAEELAARGFDLVLVARRADRLQELAEQVHQTHGSRATILPIDLTMPDAPQAVLDATAAIDVGLVVSNAGFGFKGDHAAIDAGDLTEMLMVNCHMPLQLARGFAPRLRERGRGGIIFTSSVEAMIGCPYSAAYSASKALVSAFGEALWAELQGDGINVLTLHPGATESEAAAKQGVDLSKLDEVMSAREVARLSLDALKQGPSFYPSEHYRAKMAQLLEMPRQTALKAMAGATPRED